MGLKAKIALVAVILIALMGTVWLVGSGQTATDRAAPAARTSLSETRETEEATPVAVSVVPIDRELDVHGDVVDATGNPIEGAKVTFLFLPGRRMMDWLRRETEGQSTETDGKGEFRLRLYRGDGGDLRISANGFAPQQRRYVQAGERLHIVLSQGVRLTVNVEDPAGIPLANATVRAYRDPMSGGVALDRTGTSDANGRCVFDDLCATPKASISAEHPDHSRGRTRSSIPSTGDQVVTVRLNEGRTISGTVRDAVAGTPIADAKLAVGYRSVTSGPDGNYEFPGIGPTSRIEASAEGYAPAWYRPGATQPFDIKMSRGYLVTGRVVDVDNRMVVNAGIVIFSFAPSGRRHRIAVLNRTETRSNGSFRMRVEGQDRVHVLVVVAKGHGRVHLDFEAKDDRDLGDIQLPASRTIAGRILDAAGQPIPRAKIEARGSNSDRTRLRNGKRLAAVALYGASDTRFTDDLGRFRFPDLAPGVYTLWVRPAGRPTHRETHELPKDRNLLNIDVRLKGNKTFTVTAVDREDRPVAGVHLSIETQEGRVQGQTGDDGIARITVEGEVVRVVGYSAGSLFLPPQPRKVRAGTRELRLVLDRAGFVSGRLVGPDGEALHRTAQIDVRRGDEILTTATVRADGTFRATVPAVGSVDLVLNGRISSTGSDVAAEQFFFSGELRGVSAGTAGLVLRAQHVTFDRSLVVRVVSPDGEPLEGLAVQAFPTKTEKGYTILRTNASGIVEFTGLPSRAVKIRYADARRHQQFGLALPAVALQRVIPNGQEITFRLRATVVMRGIATLPDGVPAAAEITVWLDESQLVAQVFSGRDGRFEFRVPPKWRKLVVEGKCSRKDGAAVRRYRGYVRVTSRVGDVKLSLAVER